MHSLLWGFISLLSTRQFWEKTTWIYTQIPPASFWSECCDGSCNLIAAMLQEMVKFFLSLQWERACTSGPLILNHQLWRVTIQHDVCWSALFFLQSCRLKCWLRKKARWISLPETNIAHENGWLEECYFPFEMAYFQGRAVSFGEVRHIRFENLKIFCFSVINHGQWCQWWNVVLKVGDDEDLRKERGSTISQFQLQTPFVPRIN